MWQLPQALAPLGACRQFIIAHLVPDPKRPGKTNKIPVGRDLSKIDAHNPSEHMTWREAGFLCEVMGDDYQPAFVLTESDPFFCLDFDDCILPDGSGWQPSTLAVIARFPGAAVEVSISGRGLHLWGYGKPGDHGTRAGAEFELYSHHRLIVLGRGEPSGNAAQYDYSTCLAQLISDYPSLQRSDTPGAAPQAFDVGPREDWRGPTDDADLIRRAMMSSSANAAFGGSAAFADLWTANVVVLGRCYPHASEPYDASSADAALAQHLAFWTGCDGARIDRLMHQSALCRDKYDRADGMYGTYLMRTICAAVGRQVEVLQDKPKDIAPAVTANGRRSVPIADAMRDITGSRYMTAADQRSLFAGCAYIGDVGRVWTGSGEMLKPDAFRVIFGGYTFQMDGENTRSCKDAYEAFTQSQIISFPKVSSFCFRPECPPSEIIFEEGRTLCNTWIDIATERKAGDPTPFFDWFGRILPNERDRTILLSYMAACLQHPGYKIQWWPVVQGAEGNGKTALIRLMTHCIGQRYSHLVNVSDIAKNGMKFNGWIRRRLFLGFEEVYVPERREFLEEFKTTVTNDRLPVESKGIDQTTEDNRANGMMTTNHKDGVPKAKSDRRYAIFFTAQQTPEEVRRDMPPAYMKAFYDWLKADGYAIMNDWLLEYPIPAEFNPTGACQRAPETSSTAEAIELSHGAIEQEIMDCSESGRVGFRGGWVSSYHFGELLQRMKLGRISKQKQKEILVGLGYSPHPSLVKGRTSGPVFVDCGTTSTLFIKSTSPDFMRGISPEETQRRYEQAQGYSR